MMRYDSYGGMRGKLLTCIIWGRILHWVSALHALGGVKEKHGTEPLLALSEVETVPHYLEQQCRIHL
jgi:hypothetical protein